MKIDVFIIGTNTHRRIKQRPWEESSSIRVSIGSISHQRQLQNRKQQRERVGRSLAAEEIYVVSVNTNINKGLLGVCITAGPPQLAAAALRVNSPLAMHSIPSPNLPKNVALQNGCQIL